MDSKKKEPPKQVDIFSDPVHIERPKSAASDTSDPGKILKLAKKEKLSVPKKEDRKRSTSGGGNIPGTEFCLFIFFEK